MSISAIPQPINRVGHRTRQYLRMPAPDNRLEIVCAVLLSLLAAGATFTIWTRDPLADYTYEAGIFLLTGAIFLARKTTPWPLALALPLAAIAAWGFVQIPLGGTVYRWATLQTALRFAALAATAAAAHTAFHDPHLRHAFLCGFAWFGLGTSVVSTLAYFTSPGMVLWLVPSLYPDNWGPFLSRNNFAQFLELSMPVALYLGFTTRRVYLLLAAIMLAAGIASASRAGAALLAAEALTAFALAGQHARRKGRNERVWFAAAALGAIAVIGAGSLLTRFKDSDPMLYRREIFGSTFALIAHHPWAGYGLGTFPLIYPEFATFDSGAVVDHAHNDWLEWAAEGGLPLALVWAAFALRLSRPAIGSIWGMGVVSVFLHGLVDYPSARFGVAAWIFLIIGVISCEAAEKKHQ
jgi:O-antigen ligase